ncbi:MAG: hypothetical protein R6U95_01120 [Bacteroidales bacterium]
MNMLQKIVVLICILTLSSQAYSQYVKIKQNNIYATAGTTIDFSTGGLYYSTTGLAYERKIYYTKNGLWNARAGGGLMFLLAEHHGYHYFTDLVYVHGENWHHIELCLGASGLFNETQKNKDITNDSFESNSEYFEWYPSLYIGYRFQLPNGKYLFRTGIGWPEQVSMSFGVSF